MNFTFDKIKASQKAINRLRELNRRLNNISLESGEDISKMTNLMLQNFNDRLADDLNISGALGEVFIWVELEL